MSETPDMDAQTEPDDREFLSPSLSTQAFWLQRGESLGSTSVRFGISWSAVAPFSLPPGFRASDPSDPHYSWGVIDAAVRRAAADRQSMIISVAHAPSWAEGPNRPSTAQVLPA